MRDYELRAIDPSEVEAFVRLSAETFHEDLAEEDLARRARHCEPERTIAAYGDGRMVATSGILTRELTVPGGPVPMAGVTAVGVHPNHRRRGLLSRMMRAQLEAIHAAGAEAVASLWASEPVIYGRFGFGLASRSATIKVRSREAVLSEPAPEPRAWMAEPADVRDRLVAIYETVRRSAAGLLERRPLNWDARLRDADLRRRGAGRLRALVDDDGYALFAVRKESDGSLPGDVVELRELIAATPAARARLWDALLSLDLSRSVSWRLAPEDDPLPHMLTNFNAVETRVADGLFVRLVDVPRALAQRAYAAPVDVVLDVADPVCPWNAGRFRLAADTGGSTCEPTTAPADLTLGATELGAAYLGGPTLALFAAAGRVEERTRGALAAASAALQGTRAPWCPEIF